MMRSRGNLTKAAVVTILAGVAFGAGEIRKEFRYSVGPKATVSVTNQYGPVSVRPIAGNQVIVTAVLNSDKVEVDQNQTGNRVNMFSRLLPGADGETGKVEYDLQVPSDANVMLHSNTGPLSAEGLTGEIAMEGTTAAVEVRNVDDAHVHIKTLDGPVTLTNVQKGHVEITSVSGDVNLNQVNGMLVEVNSNSGKIHYDGNFGDNGQYRLMSNTGDIESLRPDTASIDVSARSIHGQVENDFRLEPEQTTPFLMRAESAFSGTLGKAASSVKLHSFSGKIHLKKRSTKSK
jgi:DUF4097 and DUF4098 domain-containing protein YvlB